MERRPESTVSADIPVRIWGMDASGKPFFENVLAGSLSGEGAQLADVHHCLKVGDVIGIQYGAKKARFEVVWERPSGPTGRNEAGVRVLANQSVPWDQIAARKQAPQPGGPPGEKRRFVRHKVQFQLDIRFPDTQRAHMLCRSTDVSGHGCYVETLVPLPINSELEISFYLESEKVGTKAVVRASDPGVGMGIEFTSLDAETEQRLQSYLEKLDVSNLARAATEGN